MVEPFDARLLGPNRIERDLDIFRSVVPLVEESSSGLDPFPRPCCCTETDEVDRRNNLDMIAGGDSIEQEPWSS